MKILFLGYNKSETRLIDILENKGHKVQSTNQPVCSFQPYDLVISFGYRHLLKLETIKSATRPPINLHISNLPYNRGAHPNFWSWVENTPSGVSIHELDQGIDTGPIIFQEISNIKPTMTFSESYVLLLHQIEDLFINNLSRIIQFDYMAIEQTKTGTYHNAKDLPDWLDTWDIKISDAIKKYNEQQSTI